MSSYIRFDWAMNRLLRNKANFAVLEGLMTTFLGEKLSYKNFWKAKATKKLNMINTI